MIAVSSVELLKELNGYEKERKYLHDVNNEEGVNKVVAKVLKIDSVWIMKSQVRLDMGEEELKVLEKMYVAIQEEALGLAFSPEDIRAIVKMGTTYEELMGLDILALHLRRRKRLSEEALGEWTDIIQNELNRATKLDDISEYLVKMVFDDGLNRFKSYVPRDVLDRGIGEGSVVKIETATNIFTEENNYVIADYGEDEIIGISKIKKLKKGTIENGNG